MKIIKFLKSDEFRWFNIFIRDILLIFIILVTQVWTNFNSKSVWFISGMLVVWVTWQLNDYIYYYKRFKKWNLDGME